MFDNCGTERLFNFPLVSRKSEVQHVKRYAHFTVLPMMVIIVVLKDKSSHKATRKDTAITKEAISKNVYCLLFIS